MYCTYQLESVSIIDIFSSIAFTSDLGNASALQKSCVWLQGDDYILYCHPNRQKTPRSDRLREWYHMLLRQAKSEGIVTYLSNLYDTFFEGGKDHRVDKPSVLHLPYFEGALCLSCLTFTRPPSLLYTNAS